MILISGIVLIAFNLRPAITTVGPLVSLICIDIPLSSGALGLITTLPLLVFAFFSLGAPLLARQVGNERALFMGLFILAIGIGVRSQGTSLMLFGGTFFIGLGIALANVLLPALIKDRFPQEVGLMTGIYTMNMVGFAALASGLSVPLAVDLNWGWTGSLRFWVLLTMIAMVVWLPQLRHLPRESAIRKAKSGYRFLWGSPLAWQITIFMGLQSFCFYVTIAWLPEILAGYGLSMVISGWMLALSQFVNIPGAFLIPLWAERCAAQHKIVLSLGLLYLFGLGMILWGRNVPILTLGIIILGFGQGAAVSLAFAFFVLRTRNGQQAAELSGMAQAVGYLLAAIGPVVIGYLFDLTHSWVVPLFLLMVVSIVMTGAGLGAARDGYVFHPEKVDNL